MSDKKKSWYFAPIKNEEGHTSPGRVGNVLHSCEDCLRARRAVDSGVMQCSKYPESRCDVNYHCVSYEYNSFEK